MDPFLRAVLQQTGRQEEATEGERSFLENISEAFRRGGEGVMADVAVYEALHNPDTEDVTGAIYARNSIRQQNALDPVTGKYLVGLTYKAATTAGQMIESAKRATVGSVLGAVVGGTVGLVGGALIPTVGEEAATTAGGVVAGAKLGASISGKGSAGLFMYKQGVGSMYADMVEDGIDPQVASIAAHIGGLPYAALELAQFRTLGKPMKNVLTGKMKSLMQARALNAVGHGVLTYAKTLTAETLQEGAQELVQIATEKAAKSYEEGGVTLDREFFDATIKRMLNVGIESLEAFALLPVPGASLEAGVAYVATQQDVQSQAAIDKVDSETKVTATTATDPEAQLILALRSKLTEAQDISALQEGEAYSNYKRRVERRGEVAMSPEDYSVRYRTNKMFREQEQARHEERRQRLGKELGAIRSESNFQNYVQRFKSHLKGKTYTDLGIGPLEGTLPLQTFELLGQQIVTATDKLQNAEAARLLESLTNIFYRGGKFQKSDWKVARKIWGPNTVKMIKTLSQNVKVESHPIRSFNDFLRSVASSMDLSHALRQNKFMMGKPKTFIKALAQSARVLKGGPKVAEIINKELISPVTNPSGQIALKAGLAYEQVDGGFELGSESFPSTAAKNIPGVERSSAAFTTAGNVSRFTAFAEIYNANKGALSDKELQDIAHILNIMTGIGDTSLLGDHASTINSIFFAPRNFFASVQVWTELFNPHLSGVARKFLAFNLIKWASINIGMLSGLSMVPGVKVEDDPDSTDYGKVVIGKTHIDFWGGQLSIARTIRRLITGVRTTAGGVKVDAPMIETISRFLQSKLGPLPSAAIDILQKQNFVGEKREITDVDEMTALIYEKITPFFIQDLIDSIRFQGLGGAALAPLSFLGVSVQSYEPNKGTEVAITRNNIAREVLGVSWEELGPQQQNFMRKKFPEIETLEQEARFEREQRNFMNQIEKGLKKSQRKMYGAMPRDVRRELDMAKISLSGVGRRVGSNWYLNDKRYNEYQTRVEGLYKDILTKLVRSNMWPKLNQAGRVEAVKRITEELKAAARREIILRANQEDFKRIRFGVAGAAQ